tara:strand:+ start:4892 stop:6274 length:1383 start_codon:yes stop_codon:yes gene_type:complete
MDFLVLGDIMLDEYGYCDVSRISPEAPVSIAKIKKTEHRLGGAANVAANLAMLGESVSLLGLHGNDQEAKAVKKLIKDFKINDLTLKTNDVTTKKTRLLSNGQQIIRIDSENSSANADLKKQILQYAKKQIRKHKTIVISDYGKSMQFCISELVAYCNSLGKTVMVDPKSKDFSIYKGADLVKPNLKEFCIATGIEKPTKELILSSALKLKKKFNFKSLLVTMGEGGMVYIKDKQNIIFSNAKTEEVFDITGAGDTVLATLCSSQNKGYSMRKSIEYSSKAASVVIKKMGTSFVSWDEIFKKQNANKIHNSIKDLIPIVDDRRAKGKRIVFTNGCFDILHSGHIKCLEESKDEKDFLIVGLNSDRSVRNLKGNKRPINSLHDRMRVLSSLQVVDAVIAFKEKTPINLIKKIKPDVVTKGGDYKKEEVVGYEFLKTYGGIVKIVSLLAGKSTSSIINKTAE